MASKVHKRVVRKLIDAYKDSEVPVDTTKLPKHVLKRHGLSSREIKYLRTLDEFEIQKSMKESKDLIKQRDELEKKAKGLKKEVSALNQQVIATALAALADGRSKDEILKANPKTFYELVPDWDKLTERQLFLKLFECLGVDKQTLMTIANMPKDKINALAKDMFKNREQFTGVSTGESLKNALNLGRGLNELINDGDTIVAGKDDDNIHVISKDGQVHTVYEKKSGMNHYESTIKDIFLNDDRKWLENYMMDLSKNNNIHPMETVPHFYDIFYNHKGQVEVIAKEHGIDPQIAHTMEHVNVTARALLFLATKWTIRNELEDSPGLARS